MRSQKFLSGAFFAYLYQGGMMAAGIFLTPFYLRVLGAHDYGIWLVGLQVLNFLLLCDLGVIAVMPRDVGQAHGRELAGEGSQALELLVGRSAKIVMLQTMLVGLVALVLFLFRPGATSGLRAPMGLILLTFSLTYPLRMTHAILTGLQDLKFLGQLRIWLWVLGVSVTVTMLFFGAGFLALACGWCLQEAGSNLGAAWRLRRIRPDLLRSGIWRNTGAFEWRWIARGMWVSLGQTASSLLGGVDLMIIARAFGPATVVIYSCTGKLVQVLQQQPQILASTALSGLSQMKTSESRDRIQKAATCLTQAMIFIGGAIFCVVLPLNGQFIDHWTGPRYFGGIALTVLFLVNFIARLIDYTLALALFAFGYEKLAAIRALMDGVLSVSLASILVRPLGLPGVVLGFVCGALLVTLPMDLYLFAREFDISILSAVRPYVPYLWRIGAVGCGAFAILGKMVLPNLLAVMAVASAIGLVYLIVALPYVLKSDLGEYIRSVAPRFWSMRPFSWWKPAPVSSSHD